MAGVTVSVHVGEPVLAAAPTDGVRIEFFTPNRTAPIVMTVERDGDDWRVQGNPGEIGTFAPQETFADACEAAFALIAEEVGYWR